jgi:hypothetical protein
MLGLESLFSATRLESNKKNDSTRLESTAPNDSTRTRLADFCRKLLESTQLQLVQSNSSKLLWLYCLGRKMSPVNNENIETLSENIWGFA